MVEEENRIEKLQGDCKILLQAKKIMNDYYSNYESSSNASKIDRYLTELDVDMDNPFFMMKSNLKLICASMTLQSKNCS